MQVLGDATLHVNSVLDMLPYATIALQEIYVFNLLKEFSFGENA